MLLGTSTTLPAPCWPRAACSSPTRSPTRSSRACGDEQFLILPHPEVATYFRRKASDYDRWLAGMRRLQARLDLPLPPYDR